MRLSDDATALEQRLAELVESIAREEWRNEDSVTHKNRDSMPSELRDAFVIWADWGGILVLDSRGAIRVFLHEGRREIPPTDQNVRSALAGLDSIDPELSMLVRQINRG